MHAKRKPFSSGPVAALATAGLAAGIAGLGIISAGAGDIQMGSFETAPTLSCPTGERLVLPHAVGDHLLDRALTPTQIVNAYVAQTAGWTNDHVAFARTVARKVAQSNPETYEVDVRDRENSRLGVFVVTK